MLSSNAPKALTAEQKQRWDHQRQQTQ
jgi:hypothetical protein